MSDVATPLLEPPKRNFFFLKVALIIILPFIVLIMSAILFYFFILYKLPSPLTLKDYKSVPLSTHIYDRNGKALYEIYKDQNRTPIKLKDIPPFAFQASIAVEDKDFYKHSGISLYSGVFRAIKDMILKHNLQGGSTLTQQLVKGALLTPERTITRKLKEIVLALQTEKLFTKDQILEMYLNQIPYGGSSYGIEEASKTYFGKHAKDLTLEEAALLAGLPQAPSFYSPYNNPEYAKSRRNEVLKKMEEQGYIDKLTMQKATEASVSAVPLKISIKAPHFVFYVKSLLEQEYGVKQVEEGGLKVITTLDLETQEQAEIILKDELEKIKDLDVTNGALLVTRPPTGEILSMVGSVDYYATGSGAFNVTTALRQPGSSIKPINYAIGIDRKLVTPGTMFLDIPTCFTAGGQQGAYCPVNYDGQFHGPVQLRMALGNSFNIPAVKMIALNGVKNFIASASAFTITSFEHPENYGLSITLGGGEVRMTEMAQAFSTFPNQGIPRKLQSILKIQDKFGKELYKFSDSNLIEDIKKPLTLPSFVAIPGKKIISQETAYLISHILLDKHARETSFGSSSYLDVPGHTVSVKTGTTDNKKDNWTIGYTPNFLVSVWVGNNDSTPMNPYLSSGVTGAAPIWNKVMAYILKNQPDLWPIKPENVVGLQICNDSGTTMTKDGEGKESCGARFEYFIKGTEPKGGGATKETVPIYKDQDKLAPANDPNIEMKEKTILKDMFTQYCVDCNHDKDPYSLIKL